MNSVTTELSNKNTNTTTNITGPDKPILFEAVRVIAGGLAGMVFYRGGLGSTEERNQSAAYAALVVIETMGVEQVKEALAAERNSLTRKDLYRAIGEVLIGECHINGYHQARYKVTDSITGKVCYSASWQPVATSFSDYAANYGSGERADVTATISDEEIVSASSHPVIENDGWLVELAGADSAEQVVENPQATDAYPERSFARLMAGVARQFDKGPEWKGRYSKHDTSAGFGPHPSSKDGNATITMLPLPLPALTQPLTAREREVMTALLEPAVPRKLVAKWLGMSDYTLRGHLKKIYYKLTVRDINEARKRFIQLYELGGLGGEVTPDPDHSTNSRCSHE